LQIPVLFLAFFRIDHGLVVALGIAVILDRHGVGALHFIGQGFNLLEADIGVGDIRVGKAGNTDFRLFAVFRNILHHAKIQGIAHAGRNTSGLETHFEAIHAHIALGHLTHDRIELWRVVGAHPGAVAAPKAGFRVLQHSAVFGVLGVGGGGATL